MKKVFAKVKRIALQRGEAEQASIQIGSPSGLILQAPRPRLDANGNPIQAADNEIDRDTMHAALVNMANHLGSLRQTLTAIAIGGAVNVLLLRSRQSTNDLNLLGTNLTDDQRAALDAAAHFAVEKSRQPLSAQWLNNETQIWLPLALHHQVTEQALQQNEVVFQHRGLKIIAAPWIYALATKTNRIAQARRGEQSARARPYDASDAADYLHNHIRLSGGEVPSQDEILAHCLEYGFRVDSIDLQAVNTAYQRLYHADGLK